MCITPRYATQRAVVLVCSLLVIGTAALARAESKSDGPDWPYEIQTPQARIAIYQPQLESFAGNKLESRAAVSVTVTGQETPVFGAVWFSARVATDLTERLVSVEEIKVAAVKFPQGEEADIETLTKVLEEEIGKQDIVFPLDELLVSLEMVDMERELAAGFNDEAPELIVVNRPTVLVMIDGAARWEQIENSQLRYVVNTPFFLVKDGSWTYLHGGGNWFRANSLQGRWTHVEAPSRGVAQVFE